jgi:hypothetical protein
VPKIFERDGYAVYVYTNEHPPPHVHVAKAGALIAVLLKGRHGAWRGDWSRRHPSAREIRRAEEVVTECIDACIEGWVRIHETGG